MCAPRVTRHTSIRYSSTCHTCVSNLCCFFCPTSFSILWRIVAHIHIPGCVEDAYQLQLLPNNTANERFLHKPAAVRSVDWIFITRTPAWRWLGEYVTLDKMFYNLLFKQEVEAAPLTSTISSLSHSTYRPSLEIQQLYFALIKNCDMH